MISSNAYDLWIEEWSEIKNSLTEKNKTQSISEKWL